VSSINLLFESSAIKYCLDFLKTKGYVWANVKQINFDRYAIVEGFGCENILITFKTDWFQSFKDIGGEGLGDTINIEHLKLAIAAEVKRIYIIHQNGSIYSVSMLDFLSKSIRWVNKEGKEVRSISIHEYLRMNKQKEEMIVCDV